jgi:hypothetical protein
MTFISFTRLIQFNCITQNRTHNEQGDCIYGPFSTCNNQAFARIERSGEQTSESVVCGFLQILLASEVAYGGEN